MSVPQTSAYATLSWGEVMVTAKTHMYKKIKFHTHENVGWGEISLPEQELHTYWFSVPHAIQGNHGQDAQSALLGTSHVLKNITPGTDVRTS